MSKKKTLVLDLDRADGMEVPGLDHVSCFMNCVLHNVIFQNVIILMTITIINSKSPLQLLCSCDIWCLMSKVYLGHLRATYIEIHLESFRDTGFKINFSVTSSFNLNFFDFREDIKKIVLIRILTKIFILESLENRNEIKQKIKVKIRTEKFINISTISR